MHSRPRSSKGIDDSDHQHGKSVRSEISTDNIEDVAVIAGFTMANTVPEPAPLAVEPLKFFSIDPWSHAYDLQCTGFLAPGGGRPEPGYLLVAILCHPCDVYSSNMLRVENSHSLSLQLE